mmetsp:Transcript_41229/g.47483  ORF Transcript_41229/g.47483 Transcript_41229/m.47483 type:complete len:181 (+) Transcript_41229:373-915(+)
MPAYYGSLHFIPTIKSALIYNINPIIISLLGVLVLSESVSCSEFACMIGAFGGVFLMMNRAAEDMGVSVSLQMLGFALAGISCITGAIGILFVRYFNKENNYLIYPFYYAVGLLLLSLIILIVQPSMYHFSHYTVYNASMFFISGFLNVVTNIFNGYALKLADVATVAPYTYVTPLVIFV